MSEQRLLQSRYSFKLAAIGKTAGDVDRFAIFGGSPAANSIVAFERKADRIHKLMTAGAGWTVAMLSHSLAYRDRFPDAAILLEGWNNRRRRRGWHSENVVEYPFAPDHRRCSGWIGRYGQNAALAQQPASRAVIGEGDAAEAAAVDVRNPVVLGKALVHERVVRL